MIVAPLYQGEIKFECLSLKLSICRVLTENDVLGQVVDELSSHDVVGQLSVQLLLLFLPLATLDELGVGPAGRRSVTSCAL